jgi:hypothetical protein
MTQHYNRPPLDPVDVYIQPVATTPGHHTITRSGGASPNANSTSPYADPVAALRAAGERADARHHLGRRSTGGELGDAYVGMWGLLTSIFPLIHDQAVYATRGPGESYSDVIVRLAKGEGTAEHCIPCSRRETRAGARRARRIGLVRTAKGQPERGERGTPRVRLDRSQKDAKQPAYSAGLIKHLSSKFARANVEALSVVATFNACQAAREIGALSIAARMCSSAEGRLNLVLN